MKIAVYTAISNDYEDLIAEQKTCNAEFICFGKPSIPPWQEQEISTLFVDPRLNYKIHKILSHLYLRNFDYTLWIDGNYSLKIDPKELVYKYKNYDIVFFKHPYRDCLYEEGEVCTDLYDESHKKTILEQLET
ncbi:DUF616 domain-containing protein, partial [Candidatus Woesearchaeota archaeon]|nr:DUF616 domain-containing protein [Candidatus Woesearchaeota archaeon]